MLGSGGTSSSDLLSMLRSDPSPSHDQDHDLQSYFGQPSQWTPDQVQPGGKQGSPQVAWPSMDMDFSYSMPQQAERSAPMNSPNDEMSRDEYFTSGYLSLGKLPACNPALLTPPTSSTSRFTPSSCPRRGKSSSPITPPASVSPAEETIRDVQELYKIGVKAGFLKQDDKVKHYLAAMRRVYQKVPSLMDEDYEGSSGATEEDEEEDDEDDEEDEEEGHRPIGAGRSCTCGKAH